jgi:hypothetical protein
VAAHDSLTTDRLPLAPDSNRLPATPIACPRTGIVHNAPEELRAGGHATVALVRPLRAASVRALVSIARALRQQMQAQQRAESVATPLHPGTHGDGDGFHIGLTFNDVLMHIQRLLGTAAAHDAHGATIDLGLHDTAFHGKTLAKKG